MYQRFLFHLCHTDITFSSLLKHENNSWLLLNGMSKSFIDLRTSSLCNDNRSSSALNLLFFILPVLESKLSFKFSSLPCYTIESYLSL
jgi:hypothetical protein